VKEKPTVGSPFFRAFPSDRSHKAIKDVSVHLFIHSFTFRDEPMMHNALAVPKKHPAKSFLSPLHSEF
jgi:hypothetical protein